MMYAVEVISEDTIYIPSFMKIGVDVQELWLQKSGGLQCWLY
jgi:hypothetical protein